MENYIFWQNMGTVAKTVRVVFSVKSVGTRCFKKRGKNYISSIKNTSFLNSFIFLLSWCSLACIVISGGLSILNRKLWALRPVVVQSPHC